MKARVDYRNHNVHYQPVILRAVPPDCGAALEVGCGDGLLARRLAERCADAALLAALAQAARITPDQDNPALIRSRIRRPSVA
jgi:hypothetical protein